jgi:hypothetical protein
LFDITLTPTLRDEIMTA